MNKKHQLISDFLLQAQFGTIFGCQIPRTNFSVTLFTNWRTMILLLTTGNECMVFAPLETDNKPISPTLGEAGGPMNKKHQLISDFLLQAQFGTIFGCQIPRTNFSVTLFTNWRTMILLLTTGNECMVFAPLETDNKPISVALTRHIIGDREL